MKQYWPHATDIKDGVSHMLFTYDSALTIEKAEKQIDLWKKDFEIVTAWIIESESGLIVWHRCYVDSLGNRRR